MLTLWEGGRPLVGGGATRRNFLSVGALTLGGLSLADLLRLEARGADRDSTPKSVIFVYLPGGPSHIDLYDMKPDAPAEIRGEFRPIRTTVTGMDVCELLPLQAKIADRFSIVRGFQTPGSHDSRILTTGFRPGVYRPAFGSVVSRFLPGAGGGLPPYVTLVQETNLPFGQDPAYLGPAHVPFALRGRGVADLAPARGVTLDRLDDRAGLLRHVDTFRRGLDARGADGADAYTARALDLVRSPRVRDAFDLSKEPAKVRELYGRSPGTQQFLLARRLVEAGARVVTLCGGWVNNGEGDSPANLSNWDTHEDNFGRLRVQAPHFDRALYALLTDLAQRGLDRDVVVVAAGEMGRAPRVGRSTGATNAPNGRDHWETGFALVAGGGLANGRVVGETDGHAGRARGRPYTPQNLLATLYAVLGIDPAATIPDHTGRPQFILDDGARIDDLL
ncbi:DUF1501 domain-containing protein [bacterium]|nr:DUF1501 domain-containing protein [bacterium]